MPQRSPTGRIIKRTGGNVLWVDFLHGTKSPKTGKRPSLGLKKAVFDLIGGPLEAQRRTALKSKRSRFQNMPEDEKLRLQIQQLRKQLDALRRSPPKAFGGLLTDLTKYREQRLELNTKISELQTKLNEIEAGQSHPGKFQPHMAGPLTAARPRWIKHSGPYYTGGRAANDR